MIKKLQTGAEVIPWGEPDPPEGAIPCPFCGCSEGLTYSDGDFSDDAGRGRDGLLQIVCSVHEGGCGASCGYVYTGRADALAKWNNRRTQ